MAVPFSWRAPGDLFGTGDAGGRAWVVTVQFQKYRNLLRLCCGSRVQRMRFSTVEGYSGVNISTWNLKRSSTSCYWLPGYTLPILAIPPEELTSTLLFYPQNLVTLCYGIFLSVAWMSVPSVSFPRQLSPMVWPLVFLYLVAWYILVLIYSTLKSGVMPRVAVWQKKKTLGWKVNRLQFLEGVWNSVIWIQFQNRFHWFIRPGGWGGLSCWGEQTAENGEMSHFGVTCHACTFPP